MMPGCISAKREIRGFAEEEAATSIEVPAARKGRGEHAWGPPEHSPAEWQPRYRHHHTPLPVLMDNAPACQCLCLLGHGHKYA